MTLRAFRLVGDGADAALDRLHVATDVRGAIEGAGEVTVWLDGPLPAQIDLSGCRVEELPADAANAVATGFERDVPIVVAADLVVRPPWVPCPPGFRGVELVVPRGMAFGSGEHASTQAALLAMHGAWTAPGSFADVGTGSGILAAYAQVRGCPRIAACDVEAAAVTAARSLLPQAEVVLGGPEWLRGPFECVVANLTAAELDAVLPAVLALWSRTAALVLGGLRTGEVEPLVRRIGRPTSSTTVGAFTALVWGAAVADTRRT